MTKLVKPVPSAGTFGDFFALRKEGAIVVFGWSFVVVLSRRSVSCPMGTWALALQVSSLFPMRGSTAALKPLHVQSWELTQGTAGTQVLGY